MQADHLQIREQGGPVRGAGAGDPVVVEHHDAVGVGRIRQVPPRGGDPARRPEQVDGQRHRVDAQVHEAAASQGRVEGGRQLSGAQVIHTAGVLLPDQHRAVRAAPIGEQLGQGTTDRRGARLEGGQPSLHEEAVVATGGDDHRLRLGGVECERLLHQDVEAGLEGGDRLGGVQGVRGADVDDVDGGGAIGTARREHLLQRRVRRPDAVLGGEGGRALGVRRGHGHHPGLRHDGGRLEEPPGDEAGSHDPEAHDRRIGPGDRGGAVGAGGRDGSERTHTGIVPHSAALMPAFAPESSPRARGPPSRSPPALSIRALPTLCS